MWGWLLCAAVAVLSSSVDSAGAGAARLVCYAESGRTDGFSECTHLVYSGDARGDKLDALLKEYKKSNPRIKIIVRVAETDKDLRTLLKSKHAQGLEINDAHRTLNKTKVLEAVEAARSAISSSGGGPLFLSLPAHPELLAKYYDLRTLVKKVDLMMVQTHALGMVKKMTYHPSRLSGMWDMMNTDSVVDLAIGLGIPSSKIVISLPATARQFTLVNETLSTPGSPTVEEEPKEIDQAELCRQLQKGRWTLERDQDLSAPYAFKDKTWISFEDSSSVDVKGKYARVRGLAGLALHRADRDVETPCGPTLKTSLAKVLNQQSRAPRAAVLRSLEHEILSAPGHVRALDALQVSPYRITQVVDSDGVIHSIREDTRTEFSCSRQGYFVHPRSCARFYRCVKFDQLSPEYTVFEFDCPAGLAFDSRYEVCVWPGSLPHSQACPGSSEIAPVPQTRFTCPQHEGYYADPENCRWFFACLDHGKAPLTAYEFRCPFGLGFDADKLKCDWPWLVPACGNIARYEAEAFGYSGAALTGAAGFQGQTADAINIAGHNSLVSGASLNNLVGIQSHFLAHDDALDSNFIASQELANGRYDAASGLAQNGLAYQVGETTSLNNNLGLVQATQYNNAGKYSTGSLILDDYRLPTQAELAHNGQHVSGHQTLQSGAAAGSNGYSATFSGKSQAYQSAEGDNSGQYVHDTTGDTAEPYNHQGSPVVPYIHDDSGYKQSSDYYDVGRYSASQSGGQYQDISGKYDTGKYYGSQNGAQYQDNSGKYESGQYSGSQSEGQYQDNSGKYDSGKYYGLQNGGQYQVNSGQYVNKYSSQNEGQYQDNGQNGQYVGKYSASQSQSQNLNGKYNSANYYQIGGQYQGNNGQYNVKYSSQNEGQYQDNSGQYVHDNSGDYVEGSNGYRDDSVSYNADYSGSYKNEDSGKYIVGVYRTDGHIGSYANGGKSTVNIYQGSYSNGNSNYLSDAKAYTGSSHTLTAGAVNVGLVGKTTLVDASNQGYQTASYGAYNTASTQSFSHGVVHQNAHVPIISQPAVSINHVGTDGNNLDGYSFVTTPTTSGVPTTATPFAVTTAIPSVTTFKTTFVPEAPKTSIKQIFGYTQPAVTFVQPTVVAVQQVTPQVQVTDYNQGVNYNAEVSQVKSESSGYDYSKPDIKFEDGISYTTPTPIAVSTFKPQGFSHNQQTVHKVESGYDYSTATPVFEEPFKKLVAYTTGPSIAYAQPTVQTYTPQAFSQQTIHREASNDFVPSVDSGYEYTKSVSYEQPAVVQYTTAQPEIQVSTYQPQVFSQQTLHNVDASQVKTYSESSGYNNERLSTGYEYQKPAVKFEEGKTFEYSTSAPVVSTYRPQSYSHQTLHKVEHSYVPISSTPNPTELIYHQPAVSVYENPLLKYTENVTPAPYVKPTAHSFSHQTLHKVEANKAYNQEANTDYNYEAPKTVIQHTTPQPITIQHVETGYNYEEPQTVVQYTTPQPIVSTYEPQVFSHQTLHKVEANKVNTYSEGSGYNYEQSAVKFEDAPKTLVQYSTPAPAAVSTYSPQSYSSQTIHKVEANKVNAFESGSGYNYEQSAIKYEEPKTFVEYSTPAPAVVSTYSPQSYSSQTIHKVEANKVNAYSESLGYDHEQSAIRINEAPQTFVQYSTPAPVVVSTYSPQSYSSQTIHKVEANKVNTYSEGSGYSYEQPSVKFEEAPKIVEYSTPAPTVSTYRPQLFSQQTIHKVGAQKIVPVSSTPLPRVELTYQEPAVSVYENPILKYTENFTPAKPTAVYSQTYQPIVQQHEVSHVQPVQYESSAQQNLEISQESYSYNQPEIQRNVEISNAGQTYSDASLVSHQYYHQSTVNKDLGKDVVFVSSTPANLIYEDHYSEYETPKKQTYQAPEYVPPKTDYQRTYSVSTARPTTPYQQSSVGHQAQNQYNYQSEDYSQQYDNANQQISFSTSHLDQPKRIESYHVSSFPGTKILTKYNQASNESPEIQISNKAEEYLPPVVSTAAPIFASTYKPVYSSVSTTHEYLPPSPEYTPQEYLPPKVENEYLPPSTTARPVTTTYTPSYSTVSTTKEYLPPQPEYNTREYLPPKEQKTYLPPTTAKPTIFNAQEYLTPNDAGASIVNFESFGYKNEVLSNIGYKDYQEYTVSSTATPVRKPNIVIETKNNLLGFGTVGPDAGLVSQVTYTTSAPISSTYASELPVRRARPKYKSTTQVPYVKSTTAFKAPDYLPPDSETNVNYDSFGLKNDAQIAYNPYHEDVVVSTSAPVQRKQNIVVQTAKSQLGYGTVSSDAGLVSQTYSTGAPLVTSTYAPEKQELVEVSVPVRRTKPKVAVVTKINDFNPLLVRKLGAVCSCQSPVLVLKGRRPTVQVQQEYDDYSNDYEDGRGDIVDNQWSQKSARIQTVQTVTTTPIVTSTFNPIIVPDDSYYQDLQESRDYNVEITPKSKLTYSENIVSSTPQAIVSSTEKLVRIRPRVKAVSVAPTYQSVLLNQEVAPTAVVKESHGSAIDSQAFDRYGPGGWRGRDETLQGSIDCQRAGLFRHPKQCNKFYSCRWDGTKQRFTLHVFNCPVQLSFDPSIGACNWPSQGPACQGDTLLTNTL